MEKKLVARLNEVGQEVGYPIVVFKNGQYRSFEEGIDSGEIAMILYGPLPADCTFTEFSCGGEDDRKMWRQLFPNRSSVKDAVLTVPEQMKLITYGILPAAGTHQREVRAVLSCFNCSASPNSLLFYVVLNLRVAAPCLFCPIQGVFYHIAQALRRDKPPKKRRQLAIKPFNNGGLLQRAGAASILFFCFCNKFK